MRRFLVIIATSLGFIASPLAARPAVVAPEEPELCEACEAVLDMALTHPRRKDDRARDIFRHPAQTLSFFRVRPGMTVVDYMPSGGWYTRILVPYLGGDGRYIGLNPGMGKASDRQRQMFGDLAATFPGKAAEWTGVPATQVGAYNTDTLPAELNGTVDRVLIFREMHNMLRSGWLYDDLKAMRALLRDDGLLGIVQHRAKPDAPAAYTDGSKGYLREQDVIAMVEAMGFQLVAKSEINANAKDPANHAGGVWELPPSLSTKRTESKEIGESDRMTLLFRKRP